MEKLAQSLGYTITAGPFGKAETVYFKTQSDLSGSLEYKDGGIVARQADISRWFYISASPAKVAAFFEHMTEYRGEA